MHRGLKSLRALNYQSWIMYIKTPLNQFSRCSFFFHHPVQCCCTMSNTHCSTTKHSTTFYAKKSVEMQANPHHGWSLKNFTIKVSVSSIVISLSVPQLSMFSFSYTSLCLGPSLITILSQERRIDGVNAWCDIQEPGIMLKV